MVDTLRSGIDDNPPEHRLPCTRLAPSTDVRVVGGRDDAEMRCDLDDASSGDRALTLPVERPPTVG
jgi:hypothetical protein